jgi:hypothetical protein
MGGASGVKDLVFRAYRAGARTVSVHVSSASAASFRDMSIKQYAQIHTLESPAVPRRIAAPSGTS